MNGRHGILRTMIGACILACFFSLPIARTVAQAAPASEQTVPALLVSDIHFEPFWDPAKVSQLVAAPIRQLGRDLCGFTFSGSGTAIHIIATELPCAWSG